MQPDELAGVLEFLKSAELLKNTIRSAWSSQGRQESVAEHTWRLCLMCVVFRDQFPDINFSKLIRICVVHDLGEAIGGDIPAIYQSKEQPKADREREDLIELLTPLPERLRREIVSLWDEYEAAQTPQAKLAKALDKLETIMQHNQGLNPVDFDYRFNLGYGRKYTAGDPLIIAIREILDQETLARADQNETKP